MTKRTRELKDFVEALARTPATPHSVNHYSYEREGNDIRRKNLLAYLTALYDLKPSVLLVGEAPGYRGTRRTGVPFSSERILMTHPFFTSRKIFSIESVDTPLAESSASIVWKTMDELQFYPLIWASFPFHPHKPGDENSNRAPTTEEIALGQPFLRLLMDIFAIRDVVAVGRAAEKVFSLLSIDATPVRHPSHGGATLFREGLGRFVRAL
jgi:uracil-DNA glycosylase